jgi:hypothetical protein
MSDAQTEIFDIADKLDRISEQGKESKVTDLLSALENAAIDVGKSWCGSSLGYHAFVYYGGLSTPPPGAHFSSEWGLMETFAIRETSGDWREHDPDQVENEIYDRAENPDLKAVEKLAENAASTFESEKSDILSILSGEISDSSDPFLERIKDDIEKLSILKQNTIIRGLNPTGQVFTRDMVAMGQGFKVSPHVSVIAKVISLRHPIESCGELGKLARKAGSHIMREQRKKKRYDATVGTNVFIGHGGSPAWKDLKDFIQDRLGLPWDEFNRVPVAGVTNIARLSEMLDSAAIAFLVMTGEDEQLDGSLHARMNVVHEAGLFQGRLGFTKAIVLLEEGCEGFSNIEGLGQIRFPKGNIQAAFEEIRRVLEREEVISSDTDKAT